MDMLGCASNGGSGCQNRQSLSPWQLAQLRPVADPASPSGGRDVPYLLSTYADKLRFMVDVDFRTGPDFLHLGVRLVDRLGMPAAANNTRVLFAFRSDQRARLFPSTAAVADRRTGLVLMYASQRADGWFNVSTGPPPPDISGMQYPTSIGPDGEVNNRPFQEEAGVGVAMSVETADSELVWNREPSRQSSFFGVSQKYSPYAVLNLTVHDLCGFFGNTSEEDSLQHYLANVTNESRALISQHAQAAIPVPVTQQEFNTVVPPASAQVPWQDYHDTVLKIAVFGVDAASINISNPAAQTWLTYPLMCVSGRRGKNVTWYSVREQDLEARDMVNMSEHFNSTETDQLLGRRGSAPNTTAVAVVWVLVRVNCTEDAYLVDQYVQGVNPSPRFAEIPPVFVRI